MFLVKLRRRGETLLINFQKKKKHLQLSSSPEECSPARLLENTSADLNSERKSSRENRAVRDKFNFYLSTTTRWNNCVRCIKLLYFLVSGYGVCLCMTYLIRAKSIVTKTSNWFFFRNKRERETELIWYLIFIFFFPSKIQFRYKRKSVVFITIDTSSLFYGLSVFTTLITFYALKYYWTAYIVTVKYELESEMKQKKKNQMFTGKGEF